MHQVIASQNFNINFTNIYAVALSHLLEFFTKMCVILSYRLAYFLVDLTVI